MSVIEAGTTRTETTYPCYHQQQVIPARVAKNPGSSINTQSKHDQAQECFHPEDPDKGRTLFTQNHVGLWQNVQLMVPEELSPSSRWLIYQPVLRDALGQYNKGVGSGAKPLSRVRSTKYKPGQLNFTSKIKN